jgi:PPOX class probable F420-dependent enzyme
LDPTRADDGHTADRLSTEPIIWIGSTRPDGRPHRAPVWFLWRDPTVLIFSMPGTVKLQNIGHLDSVVLGLDSADGGRDIVIADGRAEMVSDDHSAVRLLGSEFSEKYRPLRAGRSHEEWREQFSIPVLITVRRVIAWTRRDGELAYRSVMSDR